MAVLVEAYHIQKTRTILHSPRLFTPKIIYLVIVAVVFATWNPWVYTVLAVLGVVFLGVVRAFRLIGYTVMIYLPPTLLILGVDYLTGTLTWQVIDILVYGYTSFINIVFVYATTPIQQFYDNLGRNPLTMALLMLHNIVAELNEAIMSKRARGWEPGWSLYRHFQIVFDALRIMITRIDEITTALRARGID